MGNSATNCINPLTDDVESWNCDCFEEMHARCRALEATAAEDTDELCLRAQMCEHPSVCEAWKATYCKGSSLTDVREALHEEPAMSEPRRLQQSLLERSSGGSPLAATGTDNEEGLE